MINGVNHHDIHPDRGPATTVDDTRRDLELMKRHHVNAVRTSHYPKDESFYDLCDELGLYVVDEADIETHGRWRATSDDPAYAAAFLERGMRMVLRDRSHPCVVAWSLGNESGYGPSHDAMAAWIRRVDPSRPLHYEGGFSRDLDAASPVSDIVCPMYASVERIVQWSADGRDRRPLILCEYNHAMGQAGGLADYWAVFGEVEGLQGGFVWEWADHGLRRHERRTATTWIAYGGDFGEAEHDGNFVCDGLVSADREPHPLLDELAALTQPVAVERGRRRPAACRTTGAGSRTSTDLEASWELTIDGRRVGRGRLDVPAVGPRSSAVVGDAVAGDRRQAGPGDADRSLRAARRRRPAWASARLGRVGVRRSSSPDETAAERGESAPALGRTSTVDVDERHRRRRASSSAGRRCRCGGRRPTTTTRRGSGGRRRRRRGWRADGLDRHRRVRRAEIRREAGRRHAGRQLQDRQRAADRAPAAHRDRRRRGCGSARRSRSIARCATCRGSAWRSSCPSSSTG